MKRVGLVIILSLLLISLVLFLFDWNKEIVPMANNSDVVWTYDISKMPIAGTVYHAKILDNGNIIYAVGRGETDASTGVAEINPATGQTVFSWHNNSWSPPEDGPETVYKYSNGNYLICDGDGGPYCYEMYPNHSLVWSYNAGTGTLARPTTINGEDVIILLARSVVKIIKRSDQSTVWEDSYFNYVHDADYRIIDGKQTLIVSDYLDHDIKRINYTTHKIERSYKIESTAGPYQLDFFDDNNIIFSMGLPSREIAIINISTNQIRWISPKFTHRPVTAKLINSTHVMAAEGQILQVIRIQIPDPENKGIIQSIVNVIIIGAIISILIILFKFSLTLSRRH